MSLLRIVSASILLATAATAQPHQDFTRSPRGNPGEHTPPAIGTAIISGTVISVQSQEPVKKAHVTLNGLANLTAVTDTSGNFTFRALPVGTYFLSATRDDFYENPLTQGANAINLKEGEERQGVRVTLEPAASISGKVLDDDGEPLTRCDVVATRRSQQMGRRVVVSSEQGNTNEQGEYHIHGLQKGRYQIQTHCTESFPAPHGFMKRNDPMIPHEGFASASYSPSSDDSAGGLRVTGGEALTGIDFHLKRTLLFTLQVNVIGAEGSRAVNVTLRAQDGSFVPMGPGRARRGDHTYTFTRVSPGTYNVEAEIFDSPNIATATRSVEIGKFPVTSLDLTLSSGSKLSGIVEFDDPAASIQGAPFQLFPLEDNFRGGFPQVQVGADGKFEVTVLPGHYRVNWSAGGYIKRLILGSQEVSPANFEIGEAASSIHLLIGMKIGKVEVDTGSKPAQGQPFYAFLIPESGDVFPNQHTVAMGDPNTGQITFASVPPGKYKVVVISGNPGQMMNFPEVMKALAERGSAVEVAEGADVHVTAAPLSREDLQKALDAAE